MNLDDYLRNNGTDLSAIVSHARARIGVDDDDLLFAVGSLVEGLGNAKSDVDLLLITPRDAGSRGARDVAWLSGKCLTDVQILRAAELDGLLQRFETWSRQAWDVTSPAKFTAPERRLLHRLRHGRLLLGHQRRIGARIPSTAELARLKLQVARQTARTIQVDLAGLRGCDDYGSLVYAAQELLGHAVDALTAGYLLTNPTPKWRSRLLASLPASWEHELPVRPTGLAAGDAVWRLHRAPERPDAQVALEHAFRIATFARAVFVWAERRMVTGAAAPRSAATWPEAGRTGPTPRLPCLDFDVDFFETTEAVYLARLNELDEALALSPRDFAVALLFDGVTTVREVESAILGATDVGGVVDRVAEARLSVAPVA